MQKNIHSAKKLQMNKKRKICKKTEYNKSVRKKNQNKKNQNAEKLKKKRKDYYKSMFKNVIKKI